MSIQELIDQYQKRIFTASDKKSVVAKIIKEINSLTYSNDLPISDEDKKKILNALREEGILEHAERYAQDNTEHLELIDQALKMLGGK